MRPCGQAEVADSAASNNAQGALVACHLWLPHLVTYGCSLFYIRLQVATELLRYSTVAGPAGTLAAPAAEVAAAYLPDSLLAPLLLTIPTCLLLLTLLLLTILLTMPRWRRRGARSTSGGRRRRTACSLTKPTITHSSLTLTFIPVAQPAARPRLVSPSRLPTAGPLGSAAERRPRGPRSAAPGRSLWRRSRRRPRCIVDRSGQSRGRRQRSSPPPRQRSRRAPPAATSYASAPTPRRRP